MTASRSSQNVSMTYGPEAEALAGQKSAELNSSSKERSDPTFPYTALIHPSVLEPKAGQILAPQRPVKIKLAPPKGWDVTGYTVTIQRKDPNGTWVNHTSIPIGAMVAHSPTGYTGFGGGAPRAVFDDPGEVAAECPGQMPQAVRGE